ncbi:ribosome-associated heat shock protein Hsp15 [Marinobacterium sediminicola]|uniref:Heat shock protein 15 n=1 Tax=Marinobacterium sediminicola TaxID=518898 RepID=A0ABY1S1Y1_9GAMM|nr:ribosome-associated heat shock protein Hsp15 [Marinobacterium sediminicola]ULG69357.1 ribosome-associated heat shock protein Hsp15 [Marinobacterium sediminicola]SMR75504.1 heat shock protein Hsp15 [Marinobacterium sediminicola]
MSHHYKEQQAREKEQQSHRAVRLDKWLWAARFYKTRALAKQMIEGGKVHYDGQRAKCSKAVEVGALIQLRQGYEEKTVEVLALSDQRRGAAEAQKLYRETEDSIKAREERALARKTEGSAPDQRPNKKSRRELLRIKGSWD